MKLLLGFLGGRDSGREQDSFCSNLMLCSTRLKTGPAWDSNSGAGEKTDLEDNAAIFMMDVIP
jgi:hypothetical protein